MTLKETLNWLNGLSPDVRAEYLDVLKNWSNEACLGYVIAASEAIRLAPSQRSQLIDALQVAFENMSVEEASCYYTYGDY